MPFDLCLRPSLTSIQVFVALAELYEEAHRYSDAVATYQRSLKLNPGQTSIFYRITRILIRLHQEDTAKPHLSEAERWAAKYGSLIPSFSQYQSSLLCTIV